MVLTDPDELVEDAEIDGLPKRSGFLSFLLGLALGGVLSVAVLLSLSLSHPLPRDLPGVGNVSIEAGEPASVTRQVVVTEQTATEESGSEASSSSSSGATTITTTTDPEQKPETAGTAGTEAVPTVESGDGASAEAPATVAATETPQVTAADTTGGDTGDRTQPAVASTDPTAQASSQSAEETPDPDLQVAAVAPTEPVQPAISVPEVPELNLSGPAIEVNSRAFEAPVNAPLLAIVLEDAGNGAVEADALSLMTMPLTLAIRPEGPESTALAQAARSAKHEVLVQLPFARSDAEQGADFLHLDMSDPDRSELTNRNLALLPDAIGVVPPDGAALLNDAQAMRSVIEPLQKHGFAFIDVTAGSGSKVEALARASGISYSETSRYVPEGATDQQVFTSLESAAFQARQRGTAIIQIKASRAALTAILRWGLEQDRRPVWFAPVSAVLKRQAATR